MARFRVPPYLSVMAQGDDVLIGLLPPRAVRIEDDLFLALDEFAGWVAVRG